MRVDAISVAIVGFRSVNERVRSPRVSKGSARNEVSTGSGSDRVDRDQAVAPPGGRRDEVSTIRVSGWVIEAS